MQPRAASVAHLRSSFFHVIFSLKGSGQSERRLPSSEPPSTYSITQASMLSSLQTPMSDTQLGWESSFVMKHSNLIYVLG